MIVGMRITLPLAVAAASLPFFAVPAFATTGCNASGWDDKFRDVSGCFSQYPAIKYLEDEGIVEGYPDGTYQPDGLITRAELTKILMAVKSTKAEREKCMTLKWIIFNDVPHDAWFAPYVCIAKQKGIIDGYPNGGFGPHSWINYAEASKIVANTYGLEIRENDGADWGGEGESWFLPYSFALLRKHAVAPTVDRYNDALTRGEMAEMIYRLETGKTSMEWFTGETVDSWTIHTPLGDDVRFEYPGDLFSAEENVMSVPDVFTQGNHALHSVRLAYVDPDVDEQGCDGMSGLIDGCRPSKSDLVINVGIVDRPVAYLELGMAGRDNEEAPDVDGRPAAGRWEGVECEGTKYVFVPLDATRSLVVTRTFDCNDPVSWERQEELFSAFLSTIRFSEPYVPQEAPTMKITVLLCENMGQEVEQPEIPTIRVERTVPRSTAVADMTLRSLFSNDWIQTPQHARDCAGIYWMERNYRGVTIANGVATVKLAESFDAWRAMDEYAAKEGYAEQAQAAVSANLKQFPSVKSVRYVVQP